MFNQDSGDLEEMNRDKTHGGGPPTLSGIHSSFDPSGSSLNLKPQPLASSSFHQMAPGDYSNSGWFSHDISGMSNNPLQNLGHHREILDILPLSDDLGFDGDLGFDVDLGVVGGAGPLLPDKTEDDLLAMFHGMDNVSSSGFNSGIQLDESSVSTIRLVSVVGDATYTMETFAAWSGYSPGVVHQHSQSMDELVTITTDMLVSVPAAREKRKSMSAAKLAELYLINPKRAKRILANRQSATRSKERRMRRIADLDGKLQKLQTEAASLSTLLTFLQIDTNGLTSEISELKLRLYKVEQQEHWLDDMSH